MSALRDELATFLFWLANKLEKRHKDAVVRYNAKYWPQGHGAVTTKQQRIFGTIPTIEGKRTSFLERADNDNT